MPAHQHHPRTGFLFAQLILRCDALAHLLTALRG